MTELILYSEGPRHAAYWRDSAIRFTSLAGSFRFSWWAFLSLPLISVFVLLPIAAERGQWFAAFFFGMGFFMASAIACPLAHRIQRDCERDAREAADVASYLAVGIWPPQWLDALIKKEEGAPCA